MQLTIAPEDQAIDQVKQLIQQARQTEMPTLARNEIIEIIATIAIYKFANRSREEVETMLGLNIEEGRLYREIKAEGERAQKLKLVPRLLAEGISIERVAALVELSVEEVRQAAQPSQTDH
jgi:predicted transposase/invertase (TIGR01784 family)